MSVADRIRGFLTRATPKKWRFRTDGKQGFYERDVMDIPTDAITIDGVKLLLTCSACPEQYGAYDERGGEVGYFRLRHGYFYVQNTLTGEIVYTANPEGDGRFECGERRRFLSEGVSALKASLRA